MKAKRVTGMLLVSRSLPDMWQLWSEKSQRIISCRIIQCHRRIRSVRITDICPESSIPARSAERRRKYTAGLQDIIVRLKTGMTGNYRNLRNEKCMM